MSDVMMNTIRAHRGMLSDVMMSQYWLITSDIIRHEKPIQLDTGRLHLVASIKLYVSFAKEPYKRDDILHKRPVV